MTPTSALRRSMGAALLGALVLAASGCAMLAPKTPEQQVEARVNDYWAARIAGDYKSAYGLSSPSYRQLHTLEQYRLQFGSGASIQGAEVAKVTCEADKCIARIKISATPALVGLNVGTIATYLSETWLLQDGQWWLYEDL